MTPVSGRRLDRLGEWLDGGVAIMVATRDRELRPHVTRGWAARVDAVSETLELAIGVPPGSGVIADLDDNGAVAVTVVRPTTYEAMQVTGVVEAISELSEEGRVLVAASIERFVGEVAKVGMPPSVGLVAGDSFVSIRVIVEQCFDQTPGEAAGAEL